MFFYDSEGGMATKKKISIDKVATRLQLLVRLKGADDYGFCNCVTCDKFYHYKDMQGGHFIPRGVTATKLMEENIHPQCSHCNGHEMQYGDGMERYELFMVDKYGRDFVDRLLGEQRAKRPYKWLRSDLEDLLKDINEEIKVHEKRVCG